MKRTKKTVAKRTYSLKGAIPTFVSLVERGANFTPFSQLKYEESEQYGQDVEINRVEFSKAVFESADKVSAYLTNNNFEDFEIKEDESVFYVSSTESDRFSSLQEVEYEDGVKYFLGKLKVEEDLETPAAEVVAAEEFAAKKDMKCSDPNCTDPNCDHMNAEDENPAEDKNDKDKDVVTHAEETVNEEKEAIEREESATEATSGEEFSETKKEEVTVATDLNTFLTTEKYGQNGSSFRAMFDQWRSQSNMIPSFDMLTYGLSDANYGAVQAGDWDQFKQNLNDYYGAVYSMVSACKNLTYTEEKIVVTEEDEVKVSDEKFAELLAKVQELEEKIQQSEEKTKENIDENEIVVQNSQSIQTDEIVTTTTKESKDEESTKFSQRKLNDLFGLR